MGLNGLIGVKCVDWLSGAMSLLLLTLLQQRTVRTFTLLADASCCMLNVPDEIGCSTDNDVGYNDVLKHGFGFIVKP